MLLGEETTVPQRLGGCKQHREQISCRTGRNRGAHFCENLWKELELVSKKKKIFGFVPQKKTAEGTLNVLLQNLLGSCPALHQE